MPEKWVVSISLPFSVVAEQVTEAEVAKAETRDRRQSQFDKVFDGTFTGTAVACHLRSLVANILLAWTFSSLTWPVRYHLVNSLLKSLSNSLTTQSFLQISIPSKSSRNTFTVQNFKTWLTAISVIYSLFQISTIISCHKFNSISIVPQYL